MNLGNYVVINKETETVTSNDHVVLPNSTKPILQILSITAPVQSAKSILPVTNTKPKAPTSQKQVKQEQLPTKPKAKQRKKKSEKTVQKIAVTTPVTHELLTLQVVQPQQTKSHTFWATIVTMGLAATAGAILLYWIQTEDNTAPTPDTANFRH